MHAQLIENDGKDAKLILPHGGDFPSRDYLAMLVIDMQPLFYAKTSAWGNAEEGLSGTDMNEIWPNILSLGQAVSTYTGSGGSVFLTQFVTFNSSSKAPGQFKQYYKDNSGVTVDGLRNAGLTSEEIDSLFGIMPQLSSLVDAGGQVCRKDGASAFAPSSELPKALSSYFSTADGAATKTLIVTGVQASYCVLATILAAVDEYYRILVVTDGIGMGTKTGETGRQMAEMMQASLECVFPQFSSMISYVTTDQLIQMMSQAQMTQTYLI